MKKSKRLSRWIAGVAVITVVFLSGTVAEKGIERAVRQQKGSDFTLIAPAYAQSTLLEEIPDVVERVVPAVVNISSKRVIKPSGRGNVPFNDPWFRRFFPDDFFRQYNQERVQRNLGSGVIVSEDGYILTNNHLVEKADEVQVTLLDNREYDARIVGTDPDTDVAVLKIEADDLPTVPRGTSGSLRLGETVLAIGYPYGVGQTVTMGIVSAVGRSGLRLVDYEYFIQTDAAINPGNSGGALINARGELIGINTAILSRTGGSMGIGFAIPIDLAGTVMTSIIEHGRVIRGYLGVYLDDVDAQMADGFDLDVARGVLISDVIEKSPAERGGLKRYDVILTYDGRDVQNMAEFQQMVIRTAPGEKVEIKVMRDGKEKTIELKVGERSNDEQAGTEDAGDSVESPLFIGVGLETLSDYHREQLDIPDDISGVIVTEIERNSPAAESGLQAGDVIVDVNRESISDINDFNDVIANLEKNMVGLTVLRGGVHRFFLLK